MPLFTKPKGLFSRRPNRTLFTRQKLPHVRCTPRTETLNIVLYVISIIFLLLAIILLATGNATELVTDYTDCESVQFAPMTCAELRNNQSRMSEACTCQYNIDLATIFSGEVTFYYGMENFFQNHRRYVKSRDDIQLHGIIRDEVDMNCHPYHKDKNGIMIAPCGSVANSMFNDTFTLRNSSYNVPIDRTGISIKHYKGNKFRNSGYNISEAFNEFSKPFFWQASADELDVNDKSNNGYLNEAFIVWMYHMAFSTFMKKYGRFSKDLSEGTYTLTIQYNYPVSSYEGRKRFIVSSDTWMGSKNNFMGNMYLTLGILILIFSVTLTVVRSKKFKSNRIHNKNCKCNCNFHCKSACVCSVDTNV